jgi:hypothetical protein
VREDHERLFAVSRSGHSVTAAGEAAALAGRSQRK